MLNFCKQSHHQWWLLGTHLIKFESRVKYQYISTNYAWISQQPTEQKQKHTLGTRKPFGEIFTYRQHSNFSATDVQQRTACLRLQTPWIVVHCGWRKSAQDMEVRCTWAPPHEKRWTSENELNFSKQAKKCQCGETIARISVINDEFDKIQQLINNLVLNKTHPGNTCSIEKLW